MNTESQKKQLIQTLAKKSTDQNQVVLITALGVIEGTLANPSIKLAALSGAKDAINKDYLLLKKAIVKTNRFYPFEELIVFSDDMIALSINGKDVL